MTRRPGRPMDLRLRVRGWLKIRTPLHVGGIAQDPAEALPVAVDGQGRVHVPGTSLAGAFRDWMRGVPGEEDPLQELWGFSAETGEGDGADPDDDFADGQASRVVVRDAVIASSTRTDADGLPVDPLTPASLPVRHGVGIDRVTGTAASEFLFARTIVPPGHYLRLELDIETTVQHRHRDRARLRALLSALAAERIRLGGAKSRGLGAVRLLESPLTIHEHDFTSPAGLLALLGGEPPRLELDELAGFPAELPDRRESLEVRIEWRPAAPVMVREGREGFHIGTLPLVTRISSDTVALVLPGSSLKGALRSHAEFIERTVRRLDAPKAPANASAHEHSKAFLAQLDTPPIAKALFGAARTAPGAEDEHVPGASALTAEECVSRTHLPADLWDVVLQGPPDDEPAEADADEERWTPRSDKGGRRPPPLPPGVRERLSALGLDEADHVAIDRWTGGAADKLLFSVLEPHEVDWEPIRLTVDLTRLGENRNLALALLLLVLRDLRDGLIPVGGMVNRGFGDIEVGSITLTGGPWPEGTELEGALRSAEDLEEAWLYYAESPR